MLDFILQRGDDFVLALQKVQPGQVRAGNGMMGDEGTVAGQMLHKELQLLETIIPAMAKQAGVTEKLKAVDPSQWIGMMNVFKAQVEEMIWKELICV